MLDKNKSGIISYNYYQSCLQAFQISCEVYPPSTKIGYASIATKRIAYLCKSRIKQLAENLDTDKPIDFADFRFFIQKQVPKIADIELMAMFIQQDKLHKMYFRFNKGKYLQISCSMSSEKIMTDNFWNYRHTMTRYLKTGLLFNRCRPTNQLQNIHK